MLVRQRDAIFQENELARFQQFFESVFKGLLNMIPRSLKPEDSRDILEELVTFDAQALSREVLHGYRDLFRWNFLNRTA